MKSLVFTSNTSFSLYNFRYGIMKKLKSMGFEVYALVPYDEYSELLKDEFEFFELRHLDRKGTNPLKDIKLFLEYFNLYKKLKPNLVLNFTIKPNIYSSLACGILRIPSISVLTGLGYVFIKKSWLTSLIRLLYRVAFGVNKFNKFIIFQNREDLKELKPLVGEDKSILIESSGVNTSYFSPDVCGSFNSEQDKIIFLFIGRLLKDKGIYEFIEAGRKLKEKYPSVDLWVLGSTDTGNPASISEEELKGWIEKGMIKHLGFARDVRPYICQADCVVLPSYYREGIPKSLLEAMAMEKPIITTDAPGCREVVEEGKNGFLVKPKDVQSLVNAMLKFMKLSEVEKREMGKCSREKATKEFDEQIVIDKYLEIIQLILKENIKV